MNLTRFAMLGLRACLRWASETQRAFSTASLADGVSGPDIHLGKTVAARSNTGIAVKSRRLVMRGITLRCGRTKAVFPVIAALAKHVHMLCKMAEWLAVDGFVRVHGPGVPKRAAAG